MTPESDESDRALNDTRVGKNEQGGGTFLSSLSTAGLHPFGTTDLWASGEAYGLLPRIAFLNT